MSNIKDLIDIPSYLHASQVFDKIDKAAILEANLIMNICIKKLELYKFPCCILIDHEKSPNTCHNASPAAIILVLEKLKKAGYHAVLEIKERTNRFRFNKHSEPIIEKMQYIVISRNIPSV